MTDYPAVLTPPELAKRWRCKPETVRRLLECGKLKGFRLSPDGGHWRIKLDAVLDYEDGEKPEPPKPRPRRRQRLPVVNGPF